MQIEIHIEYFEEDGTVVAVCPELQVSSFGDTLEDAEASIEQALELFFEGCESLGTLHAVLEESGYRKVGDKWTLRTPLISVKTTLLRSAGTVSHA